MPVGTISQDLSSTDLTSSTSPHSLLRRLEAPRMSIGEDALCPNDGIAMIIVIYTADRARESSR